MSEKDIDKLFGDKLGDFEMKPSDDLWSRIAGDIGNTYVPDGGASTSSGAESTGSSASSASSSASSVGSASSAASAVKGGASIVAKLSTLKTAVIGITSAVGITTAVVLSTNSSSDDTMSKESSNKTEQVVSDESNVKDINFNDQLENSNSNSLNDETGRLDKTVSIQDVEKETDHSLEDKSNSRGVNSTENKASEELNETSDNSNEKELEESSPVINESRENQEKEESLSSSEEDNSDLNRDSSTDEIETESVNKEKESKEEISENSKEEQQRDSKNILSDNSDDKPERQDNSEKDNSEKEESLKGDGNKLFDLEKEEKNSRNDNEKAGENKSLIDLPPKEYIFKIDSFTEVTDSSMIAAGTIDSKKKKSILPFKSSFSPVGIYYGFGLGIETTNFRNTDGQNDDRMGSLALRLDLGYEFKNGLYFGTGVSLMASELISNDYLEFEITKLGDQVEISDTYISNGLIETHLSSDWINANLDLFNNGILTVIEDEEEEGEDFDFDDLTEEELAELDNFVDWYESYGFIFSNWYNDLDFEENYHYNFSDQVKIVDAVNRTVIPLRAGYNFNKRRLTYFGQFNAEIHAVSNWTRELYYNGIWVDGYTVSKVKSRMFYGGNLGVGYHFTEGFELRSSISWSTGLNTYEHGQVEGIRLNNSGLNLSLRWRL